MSELASNGENKDEEIGERLDGLYGAEGGEEVGGLDPVVASLQGLSPYQREHSDPRRGFTPEEVGALERAGTNLSPLGAEELEYLEGTAAVRAARFAKLVASSCTTAEVAAMLGRSEGRIRQRVRDRTLYALPASLLSGRRGHHRLPAFQFEGGEEVPGIGAVLEVLDPGLHPLGVLNWFTLPNTDLYLDDNDDDDESEERPVSPREWLLAGGDPGALVPLAREL